MGWFLTGGALLQNCSRCPGKMRGLVLVLQRLDAAGDWNRPGRVEKPSSVTTRLKGEKGEAEQQGTSSAWGVGVDGRAKKKCRIER